MRKIVKQIVDDIRKGSAQHNKLWEKFERDSFYDQRLSQYYSNKHWVKENKKMEKIYSNKPLAQKMEVYFKIMAFSKALKTELKGLSDKTTKYFYKLQYDHAKIKVNGQTKIVFIFTSEDQMRKKHIVDVYYIDFRDKKMIELIDKLLSKYGLVVLNDYERDELHRKNIWNWLFVERPFYNYTHRQEIHIEDKELIDLGILDKKYYLDPKSREKKYENSEKAYEYFLESFVILAKEKYLLAAKSFIRQSIKLLESVKIKTYNTTEASGYFQAVENQLIDRIDSSCCNSYHLKNSEVLKILRPILKKGRQIDTKKDNSLVDAVLSLCKRKLKAKISI
jgi:hypothetical protein